MAGTPARLAGVRKLNANYYNPRDGQIWHVPGFCAFRHRCAHPAGDHNDAREGERDQ